MDVPDRAAMVPESAAPAIPAAPPVRAARWLLPAIFAVSIAAAYSNALHGPFVFDDWHTIEQNPHIRRLAEIPRFFVDPNTTTILRENMDLRPLLVTTFAVNYAVSGSETWSYHVVNLLLHWVAVLLVFRIVRDHLWLGHDAVPVAAAAALIVALHPLNSEPVNYLASRSALLTAAFYLGAFDAAIRDRRAWCCLLAACAMLTKAIALTLPVMVLLHALFARRVDPPEARRAIPWSLVGFLVVIVAAGLAYRRLLLPPWVVETAHQPGTTPWIYFVTEWSAYLYYLRLFVWPDALVIDRVDYPWTSGLVEPQAWGSLLGLFALGVIAWRLGRWRPACAFAALWFVVTLAPESSVFPLAEAVNEHRPYLGMLGLGTLAALGLWGLAGLAARQIAAPRPWLFGVAVAFLAGLLGSATYSRNFVYADDLTLWLDATGKAPRNARAWLNAGHAAMARRDDATARGMLLEARRLSPCYADIQMNLSALEALEGKLVDSLRWADEAVRCNPGLSLARQYRAAALERLGRFDEALEEYHNATEIDGMSADAWLGRGRLLEQQGSWAAAATAYDRAFAANPPSVDAAMEAGLLYHYRLGDSGHAVERYRALLDANPTHYGAHYQLAVALLAMGKVNEAVTAWRAFVPMAEAIGDRASIEGGPAALREAGR